MLHLALVLGGAAFLIVNAAVSLAVAGLASRLLDPGEGDDPARREGLLFGLRLLPGAAAIVFALVLFLPSFILFEPRGSAEPVGGVLTALGCGGLLLFGRGLLRGLAAWRATRKMVRGWLREAEPLGLAAAPGGAFRIRDAFPVVTVVGVLRPRLLLASQVLDALSADELGAAVAHEAAHLRSRDNLKRLLLRSCPDLLALLPIGARLEHAWARASEAAADVRAAGGDPLRAVDLGAALVKVARLTPPGAWAGCAASALHDGDDVSARVRRLLAPLPGCSEGRGGHARLLGAMALLALAALLPQLLVLVHQLTEAAVLLGR